MRKALVFILVCISAFCFPQKINKHNALFTIRGNVGIPRPVSSQMFRTCFAGVYEANVSANIRLLNNFYFGVGYQNTYFQNNKFLKRQYFNVSIPYNTSLMTNGGFMKLTYDNFFSDKGYVSYSVNAGMIYARYADVNPDTSIYNKPYGVLKYIAPYVQPEVSVNFIVDKRLAVSLMLSYTTLLYKFDPKGPRFNQFDDINQASNNYYMGWINIGFGFHVLLGK